MWAVLLADESDPVAWIYRNQGKQYWIQANTKMSRYITQYFSPSEADALLNRPTLRDFAPPKLLPSFHSFDTRFKRMGAVVVPCFARPLPDKDVGDREP